MMTKSKLALIAAIAAVSIASPAFAQSFNPRDGTGNELPFSYGPGAARIFEGSAAPQQNQNGLHSFAMVPRDQSGLHSFAMVPHGGAVAGGSNNPTATGGGSEGYNELLLQH
jgi:hypothetical protein